MGQAKKRGTYEQRKAEAIARKEQELIIKPNDGFPKSKVSHLQAALMAGLAAGVRWNDNITNNNLL